MILAASPSPGNAPASVLDQPTATLIAAGIAGFIALTVFVVTQILSARSARVDRAASFELKRVELRTPAFAEVLRKVHAEGTAIHTQAFNWTEVWDDPSVPAPRPRAAIRVPRGELAEVRGLVAAYGTSEHEELFDDWLRTLDDWAGLEDGISWSAREEEHSDEPLPKGDVMPLADAELKARRTLTDALNASLRDPKG